MRILDRYIIKSFVLNYLLALLVLVGMYWLLDLIINFDKFIKGAKTAGETGALNLLGDIFNYYGYQMLAIYQLVSGAVPLLAAGFTMVRMSRHNELTAMLASGVSLYRVATPIVIISILFSLLAVFDQEVLMPQCQDKLLRKHEEVNVPIVSDINRFEILPVGPDLVTFVSYDRAKQQMKDVVIIKRDLRGAKVRQESADVATWVPADSGAGAGGPGKWVLEGHARYVDDPPLTAQEGPGNLVDPSSAGKMESIDYTSGLKPRHVEVFLSKRAIDFLSTAEIHEVIADSPPQTKPNLEKVLYTRFTQPLMNIIMLLLGIPFLLTREPGRLVKNILYCVLVAGNCFVGTFVCFQMGGSTFSPLLGAWLPVLIFAPIALAALDSIRT